MKKIVLVEPRSSFIHVYSDVPIPRLGSVLLGTILRNLGYRVKVFIEEMAPIDTAALLSADLVGISTLTPTAPRAYALADRVRERGIPVVMGGTHPTFETEEALRHADYVIRGEGEDTLVELMRCLEGHGDPSAIAGLSYWDGDRMVHNPPRALKRDLDSNPIPDFTLVEGIQRHPVVSVMTGRGCPFDCTFCSVPAFNGKGFRAHSVDRVLAEVEHHLRHHKVRYLFFADDIFNYNKRRTKEILRGMIANKLTPAWGAQVRHEAARDPELMELMRRANCERVFVGFESINPKTLALYRKKESLQNIQDAITTFHRYGIKVHGMFVLGSDEDTVETVRETRRFAQRWDIDSVQFMVLTPIPGSHDYGPFQRGERKLLTQDWRYFDGHHVVHTPQRITPYELQVESAKAMRDFYSWKGILARLFRGDFYEVMLRYIGRRLVRQWFRTNTDYIQRLKDLLYREVEALTGRPVRAGGRCIAIARTPATAAFAQSLEAFCRELGIKVVQARRELDGLISEKDLKGVVLEMLEEMRGRTDYLLLPLEKFQSRLSEELTELSRSLRDRMLRLPHVLPLPADDAGKTLRHSLTALGLLFTEDLRKIQRAYRKAFPVKQTL